MGDACAPLSEPEVPLTRAEEALHKAMGHAKARPRCRAAAAGAPRADASRALQHERRAALGNDEERRAASNSKPSFFTRTFSSNKQEGLRTLSRVVRRGGAQGPGRNDAC
jgi:hypothetical protein